MRDAFCRKRRRGQRSALGLRDLIHPSTVMCDEPDVDPAGGSWGAAVLATSTSTSDSWRTAWRCYVAAEEAQVRPSQMAMPDQRQAVVDTDVQRHLLRSQRYAE